MGVGSGATSGGGGPTTVLVHEHVTGGGLAGRDVPPSWAAEGAAMRRAIVADFAAVPGVRVVMTLDDRLPDEPTPADRVVRVRHGRGPDFLLECATQAHYTLAIAPEPCGTLAGLAEMLARARLPSLGSEPGAIALAADKARLAARFAERGVPTPPSRVVVFRPGWASPWGGPVVVKPVDGAGAIDTFVVEDAGRWPIEALALPSALVQPFLPGTPMSASFLVDADGRATCLAVGRQHIAIEAGRIGYRGGTLPVDCDARDLGVVERALGVVRGLRGFVGVDFLLDEGHPAGERVTVLEINPRPTTSYVGLARLLPPGTIAGAWLAACGGGLSEAEWPGRLRLPSSRSDRPISFAADGTMAPEEPSQ